MKGTLTSVSAAEVLSGVQRQQISGILRVQKGPGARQIFVDAGAMIRFAASTFPNESMTQLFKDKGGLTEDGLRQATAAKHAEELLGTTLVRIGLMARETLTALTEEHIRRVVHGALLMRDGDYQFQAGALPFREQLDGGLSTAEILLEWSRDVPDLVWVKQRIGPDTAVVMLSRRPPEGYQKVPLNPAEGYTMSRVDGRTTLRDICIVSPVGEETTLRALLGLAMAGILELPETPGASPSPATAPVAPRTTAPIASRTTAPAGPPTATPPGPPRPGRAGAPPATTVVRSGKAPAPGGARPAAAVLPGRAPKNGGAPHKPAPTQVRRAVPAPERVRPAAGADLESEVADRFARMREQNLYEVLAIQNSSGTDDIRRAYYALARRLHPDKFTREEIKLKAEKVFGHITEAYSTLSKPETRKKYEEDLALHKQPQHHEKTDTADLARSNFKVGKEQFDKGHYGEALSFFQNACDQDPSKSEHFHYLGMTQAKNPRWKKDAESNFLRAIEIDPSDAVLYAQLGSLYTKGGLQSKAREMFRKALQWDPANEEALAGLAGDEGAKKGLLGLFKK